MLHLWSLKSPQYSWLWLFYLVIAHRMIISLVSFVVIITGIFNGVAPNAVTNIELTRTAAPILRKPLFLPNILKFLMKLILGEMHIILFESQRVSSTKIENTNFLFKYNQLKPALTDLLT